MTYRLEGFQTYDTTRGCDCETAEDTLKATKKRARYMPSDAYTRACETDQPIVVVHILRDGELVDEVS